MSYVETVEPAANRTVQSSIAGHHRRRWDFR